MTTHGDINWIENKINDDSDEQDTKTDEDSPMQDI